MTDPQAQGLWALLLAAYPHQPLEAPTQALYVAHLKALPWREGRTEAAIRGLLLRHASAFLPSIAEVVQAAGVAPEASHLLVDAMTSGRELVPDLASRTGWAVGAASVPIPVGPAEAPPKALNPGVGARPEPPEPTPEGAFSEEERRENLRRLGGLFRAVSGRGKAS